MCGILGAFGDNVDSIDLSASLTTMLDRGPDSHQVFHPTNFVKLGAARLAMTDPHPRSNQPFTKNGDWIVFNGEIYNYKEIRLQLEDECGVRFETQSDTEVLLEVLRLFGRQGVQLLNGMYAFAFFDINKRTLLLARDSLGKKPLYFALKENCFIWASTLRAVQEMLGEKEISTNGVLEYLTLGYILDPSSIYSAITAVKPGYCYEVQRNLSVVQHPIFGDSDSHLRLEDDLDTSLTNAVWDRLDGHEKVAVSLSGGLDSSIVASIASKTDKKVVAYSIFWSDSDKDRYNQDYKSAQIIAENLGIDFVGVDFGDTKAKIEKNILDFVSFMGEPNSNPTGLSMIPLYRRVSEDGIRLVLTGDGADEIFGGYPRYQSKLLGTGFRLLGDNVVRILINAAPITEKAILRLAYSNYPGLWANFHWNFKPREVEFILNPKLKLSRGQISQDVFSAISDVTLGPDNYKQRSVEAIMRRDSSVWLSNESNRKLDRISMAFSVEARSPFQDDRVIKKAKTLMMGAKFRNPNKEFLRTLYPEVLAAGVRIDKAGFISPVGHWLRSSPELIDRAFESLHDSGLFRHQELQARTSDQYSGDFNRIRQLWSLVILGYWFRVSGAL